MILKRFMEFPSKTNQNRPPADVAARTGELVDCMTITSDNNAARVELNHNTINGCAHRVVTAHKPGAVAPGVASPLTRSSSQDVSDELPAGRKKFQL